MDKQKIENENYIFYVLIKHDMHSCFDCLLLLFYVMLKLILWQMRNIRMLEKMEMRV